MITEKRIENITNYMVQLRQLVDNKTKFSTRKLQRNNHVSTRINTALVNAGLLEISGGPNGRKYITRFPKEIQPITARSVLLELGKLENKYRNKNNKEKVVLVTSATIKETKTEARYKKRIDKLKKEIIELKKPKISLYLKIKRFVRKYFWFTFFGIACFLLGFTIALIIH